MKSAPSWTVRMFYSRHPQAAALVAAFSLFFMIGCAGRAPKMEIPEASPEGAEKLMANLSKLIPAFEGDFSLSFQAFLFKGTFFGQCWLKTPDQFAAELKAPLGIRAGEVVISDGVYELNMGNGQMESGNVDSLDFAALTGLALPTDNFMTLFDPMPRPPSAGAQTIHFEVLGDDSLWLWTLDDEGMEHQIELAPRKWQIRSETWYTPKGDMVLKKLYRDYKSIDGAPVAHKLKISAKGKLPVVVELTFNRVKANPRWKETPFQFKWASKP